jgi:hypothetical protein
MQGTPTNRKSGSNAPYSPEPFPTVPRPHQRETLNFAGTVAMMLNVPPSRRPTPAAARPEPCARASVDRLDKARGPSESMRREYGWPNKWSKKVSGVLTNSRRGKIAY